MATPIQMHPLYVSVMPCSPPCYRSSATPYLWLPGTDRQPCPDTPMPARWTHSTQDRAHSQGYITVILTLDLHTLCLSCILRIKHPTRTFQYALSRHHGFCKRTCYNFYCFWTLRGEAQRPSPLKFTYTLVLENSATQSPVLLS